MREDWFASVFSFLSYMSRAKIAIDNVFLKDFFNFQISLSIVHCELFWLACPNLPRSYPVPTPLLPRSYSKPSGLLSRIYSEFTSYLSACYSFATSLFPLATSLLSAYFKEHKQLTIRN